MKLLLIVVTLLSITGCGMSSHEIGNYGFGLSGMGTSGFERGFGSSRCDEASSLNEEPLYTTDIEYSYAPWMGDYMNKPTCAPVPEPSSVILLGTGLVALTVSFKKNGGNHGK